MRRLLVGAVIAVCVVIVFLFGTGTEPSPEAATTVPMSTTLPWVDRTTPSDIDPDTSALEQRVAALLPWVEENRGLPFLRPLDIKVFDEHGRDALAQEIRDSKDYEWPAYELVTPFFGVEFGPDDWWGLSTLTESLVIPIEFVEFLDSTTLVALLVPSLTNQHHHHLERMDALLRSGSVGDELDALRTLVSGDAGFIWSGFGFAMATGEDWIPAFGGCLATWQAGESYVCNLYEEGGWDRVNQEYTDPPRSTAEILGIECTVEHMPLTPVDWPVRFEGSRGPLWLSNMLSQLGGDIGGIKGWCADYQRVFGDGTLQFLVMEIWLGSPEDALIVETATREHFAAVDESFSATPPRIKSLIVRDGSWVGIASTVLSDSDLCVELPSWCP